MENAELIDLLRERGHEVKSASSTIDNISADYLREELAKKKESAGAAAEADSAQEEEDKPEESGPALPPGAIVRSKEDIERERREREEEERKKAEAYKVRQPSTPPPPPTKAPPPLPRKPVVQRRTVPAPPGKPPSGETPTPPKAPVLRTDLPPPEPKKEEPAEQEQKAETPPPARKGPPPLQPPAPRGPKTVAPPKVSIPAAPTEAGAGEDEKGGEESASEAGGEDLKPLEMRSPIVVRDFAHVLGRKPFQLISELMEMSIFASMNSTVDEEVAQRIARHHGFQLQIRHRGAGAGAPAAKEEKEEAKPKHKLEKRPPVICILGHVDHGKTTLLDAIRKANVVATEAGGITQHIGAYQVSHKDELITFIDTPGHAAFSNMRARGARTTDIVILVVAADDGFMPQTDEALGHARVAKVPVVVAINKIDAPGANVDRVLRQMQERELTPEAWGGETLLAQVSAIKAEGLDDLLESIVLQAEVTEGIEASSSGPVEGVILEAHKELGRGSTASVIVQQGTLKPGTALVCGEHYCRVRQLIDDKGKQVKSAGPSTPVKVIGWSGPPDAGDVFQAVKNERTAKREAEENELKRRKLEAAEQQESGASVDDLFAAIEKTQKKSFRCLVKADVYGTAEALATSLLNIKSDKIDLEVVDMGVGDVTRNDIIMASAAEASIVAFNVGLENGVQSVAKHHDIRIIQHNIIYEIITQVQDAMADLLEPELRENKVGAAQVRATFPLGKGVVAGCMVTEGRVRRDALSRLMRGGEMVAESKIGNLKRFKEDATEVRAGYECGIQLAGVNDYQEGDVIEVFEILKEKPSL
jgi:translation initiation factor IF-2